MKRLIGNSTKVIANVCDRMIAILLLNNIQFYLIDYGKKIDCPSVGINDNKINQ
jgi:hypothetical protein